MDDLVPSSPAAFPVSRTIIFFNCSWQGGLLSRTSSLFRFPYLSEHFIRTWVCSRKIMPLISCKTTTQRWICNIGHDILSRDGIAHLGQHRRESKHDMKLTYYHAWSLSRIVSQPLLRFRVVILFRKLWHVIKISSFECLSSIRISVPDLQLDQNLVNCLLYILKTFKFKEGDSSVS